MPQHALLLLLVPLQMPTGKSAEPRPRIVLLGEVGAGKSTLGNRLVALAGSRARPFTVGEGFDAATQNVTCFATKRIEVCDTPGFGDESGRQFVDEIVARPTHGIVYVHNANQPRMTKASKRALKLAFGGVDMDRLLVAVTRSVGSRLFVERLAEAMCRRLGACDARPKVVFAGARNPLVDVPTLVSFRFRARVTAWLRGLATMEPIRLAASSLSSDQRAPSKLEACRAELAAALKNRTSSVDDVE